jgi:hypothetical protein
VGPLDEVDGRIGELVVCRLHALARHGPGVLDLLPAVAVGPGVEHAAGAELLPELSVLGIVVALGLLLGVEVVEVAEELVEAVDRRQMLVLVAEVVLAELPAGVAVGLEECGERHHAVADPLVRAGHPDGEQSGAEGVLAEDEGRAPGGAALLSVPVGEERALVRQRVDAGRLVAHHPLVVSTDVPVADIVPPDDQDIRLALDRRGGLDRQRYEGREGDHWQYQSVHWISLVHSCPGPVGLDVSPSPARLRLLPPPIRSSEPNATPPHPAAGAVTAARS